MKLSIRFYLSQQSKSETIIVSSVTFNGIRIRTSTGITIPTKYWSKTTQKVKSTYRNAMLTNGLLEKYKANIESEVLKLVLKDETITKEILTDIAINSSYSENNRAKAKPKYLSEWMSVFLQDMERRQLKSGSLGFYENVLRDFELFEKWSGRKNKVSDVNRVLMLKYTHDYLMEFKGSTNNTAISYFTVVKTFLKYLEVEQSQNIDNSYRQVKISRHESRELTITINEFKTLLNLDIVHEDLHHQRQLKLVRDRFILSVLTGLRNSDINQIKPTLKPIIDSDGEQFYLFKSQKTRSEIRIPIIGIIKTILTRNDFDFHNFSPALAIYYLKDLFKVAGIDRMFTKDVKVNNEIVTVTKPAYEFVGTHTGRRSTVTILRGLGIPNTKIMQVTTHKTESMILRYDNTEQKTAVNEVYTAFENAMNKEPAKEIANII